MKSYSFAIILAGIITLFFMAGCGKETVENPIPLPPMSLIIDPNSTMYQELNVPGGWTYLGFEHGVNPPSRGVIVYRYTLDEFRAYDRMPPYKPDSCCISGGSCTQLIVEGYYPFAMDTCTGSKFLLIDGQCVEGSSVFPLLTYQAEYDGELLYIHD